jgi:hypothetical protein
VVAFDDEERVEGGRARGTLAARSPAPASRHHDLVALDEDDLARLRVEAVARSEVGEQLGAGSVLVEQPR